MSKYQKMDSEQLTGENNMENNSNSPPPYSLADPGCVIEEEPKMYQPAPASSTVLDGWMPVPEHIQNNIQNGLQCLMTVDQLNVIQKKHLLQSILGFVKNNEYIILNNVGQKMFYALEDTNLCKRYCLGPYRSFKMGIMDSQGHEIIQLVRPYGCWLQKIKVFSPPGCLVGTVEQKWACLTPTYTIRNASKEEVLKIKGPVWRMSLCGNDVKFQILSKDETFEVGHISKKWSGLVQEMFTDADNFSVSFPMDLDVHMKAVLIGACFLIDYMFFEKHTC